MKGEDIIKKWRHRKLLGGIRKRKDLSPASRDFSAIEDHPNRFRIIKEMTQKAGRDAAREAITAGLQRAYTRNGALITISSDGVVTPLASKAPQDRRFYLKTKPGTILHVHKK